MPNNNIIGSPPVDLNETVITFPGFKNSYFDPDDFVLRSWVDNYLTLLPPSDKRIKYVSRTRNIIYFASVLNFSFLILEVMDHVSSLGKEDEIYVRLGTVGTIQISLS